MQRYKLIPVEAPSQLKQWPKSSAHELDDWGEKVSEILDYLPKALKNRARMVLMSLRGHIGLSPEMFVIYKSEDGKEDLNQGSSIISLLHWVITATPPSGHQQ